jgi:RNA polymerase sigma factor (sigma-70 family)
MSTPADKPVPAPGHDPAVAARVEQLYADHAELVRSVCRSLLRDRLEAEDAMQQTFLSAHRTLANGTSPRDDPAWLATIARHECLARVRARMREPLPIELEEASSAADAHAAAVRRHDADQLRTALAELPAQQREAILLREVRGLSYQEVASALSVTTSAVESLVFRARRSLQARLRGALAALSPGWLASARELAVRAGGGVAAPTAAKVAAVGVGTVLFAGGALTPTMIGLGHAPSAGRNASRPPAHRAVRLASPKASVQPRLFAAGPRKPDTVFSSPRALRDVVRSSARPERAGTSGPDAHRDDGNRSSSADGRSGSSDDSSTTDGGGGDRVSSSTGTAGSSDDSSKTEMGSSDDSSSPATTIETTTTDTSTDTTTTAPTTTVGD